MIRYRARSALSRLLEQIAVPEIVAIVNEDDEVTGKATKTECHAQGLRHRCVFVFLFDRRGRLLVQRRSTSRAMRPGKTTASACGHVLYGESYEQAAHRELHEELGIVTTLRFVLKTEGPYVSDREIVALFVGLTEVEPVPNKDEIDNISYLSLSEIQSLRSGGEVDFGSTFLKVLDEYRQVIDHDEFGAE